MQAFTSFAGVSRTLWPSFVNSRALRSHKPPFRSGAAQPAGPRRHVRIWFAPARFWRHGLVSAHTVRRLEDMSGIHRSNGDHLDVGRPVPIQIPPGAGAGNHSYECSDSSPVVGFNGSLHSLPTLARIGACHQMIGSIP
jgi:hypothetical protein